MPAEQTQPQDITMTKGELDERQVVEVLLKNGKALLGVPDEAPHAAQKSFILTPFADHLTLSQLTLTYCPPDDMPQRLSVLHSSLTYSSLSDLAQIPTDIFFHADIFSPGEDYQTVGRDSSKVLSLPETLAMTVTLLQEVPYANNRRRF